MTEKQAMQLKLQKVFMSLDVWILKYNVLVIFSNGDCKLLMRSVIRIQICIDCNTKLFVEIEIFLVLINKIQIKTCCNYRLDKFMNYV